MNTILPPHEELRRAAEWVKNIRRERTDARLDSLVEEACLRFDLSPADSAILTDLFLNPIKKEPF